MSYPRRDAGMYLLATLYDDRIAYCEGDRLPPLTMLHSVFILYMKALTTS